MNVEKTNVILVGKLHTMFENKSKDPWTVFEHDVLTLLGQYHN